MKKKISNLRVRLSIGVVNLNDESEISARLDEVERANPEYQKILKEAVEEIILYTDEPLESINKEDIASWLLSLGD